MVPKPIMNFSRDKQIRIILLVFCFRILGEARPAGHDPEQPVLIHSDPTRKKSSRPRSIQQNDRVIYRGVSSFHACESISPARAPVSVIEGRKCDENEYD